MEYRTRRSNGDDNLINLSVKRPRCENAQKFFDFFPPRLSADGPVAGEGRMKPSKQVALLIETSNAYARGLLRGIMAYVREHEPWAFFLTEHGRGEVGRNELAGWRGHGAIARVENEKIAAALRRFRRPAVDVSAARLLPHLPWVETDDEAIARAAADHLLARGLRNFGFCGDDRFNWSRWRRQAFRRYLAGAGLKCSDGPARGTAGLAEWVRAPRLTVSAAQYLILGIEEKKNGPGGPVQISVDRGELFQRLPLADIDD